MEMQMQEADGNALRKRSRGMHFRGACARQGFWLYLKQRKKKASAAKMKARFDEERRKKNGKNAG